MSEDSQLLERAEDYAHRKGILILRKDMLGYGSDGSVNIWFGDEDEEL